MRRHLHATHMRICTNCPVLKAGTLLGVIQSNQSNVIGHDQRYVLLPALASTFEGQDYWKVLGSHPKQLIK
eukprot:748261-Ditylum_brightwellii.AAC.1